MSDFSYVKLQNITKSFGSVIANKNITIELNKGEIHALLGENGSGKSTLVNMLSGIYRPDSGQIFIDGKETVFSSPKDSIHKGIGMIHQHLKLVDILSAKENIILGMEGNNFFNGKQLSEEIYQLGKKYGLIVNPDKKVYEMSISEKQTVEILKVLYRGAKILILDEPTAVLTPQETQNLFKILKNMKKEGCAVVIITHKLNEVMEVSDCVTVLRKGECMKTVLTSETNTKELTEMMVGRPVSLEIERRKVEKEDKHLLLEVKNLSVSSNDRLKLLDNLSFHIDSGEILGVAGIAGSGQKELCETIAGLCKADDGSILLDGKEILGLTPQNIIRMGIAMSFIPEDRLGMGLVANMSIIDNVLLKTYQNKKGLWIDRQRGRAMTENIIKKFNISTPSSAHQVKKLSGGNIQKVLLGREIELNPRLLITAYPVRGLDIASSYNIYDVLNEQKGKGVGILFIGEDLDVLLSISDRLMVIHDGEIMDIVDPEKVTKEEVGFMMLGERPKNVGGMQSV